LKSEISNLKSAANPAKLLLQHFDSLAETPGAIPKLRTFILNLAVQGKLGGELPTDNKRQSLASLVELISGQHLRPEQYNEQREGVPYLTGPADFGPKYPTASRWTTSPKATARKGDILLTVKGAGVGKTNVVADDTVAISRQLMALRPTAIHPGFLELNLRAAFNVFQAASNGIAIPGISRGDVLRHEIWLPPLPEQRRIVAKVEELLALCDQLEARQTTAREHRTHLVHSALDHLTTAKNDHDSQKHVSFILHKSPLILDSVAALRQAILSLAVQGRLTSQSAEEPASVHALERRRQRLEQATTTRRNSRRDESNALSRNGPFPAPSGWIWIRLGEIADRIEYGTSERATGDPDGVPTLRMGNIQAGKLDYTDLKYVSRHCPDLPNLFLEDGDIIFNRTNSAELVGKAAVFRGQAKAFTLASYLIRVSLDPAIALPEFFGHVINSSYYRTTQIEPELTQQCGQANFSGSKLANSVVPLPPLAEQKRVVAKLEELMSWCDQLETNRASAQKKGSDLLDAVLSCSSIQAANLGPKCNDRTSR